MRILVCGGRDFGDKALLWRILDMVVPKQPPDEHGNWMPGNVTIIQGGARGADTLAHDYAVVNWVQFETYYADWKKHGKAAGHIRNQRMLDEGKPDLVVAFPGGRGTNDMTDRAMKAGVETLWVNHDGTYGWWTPELGFCLDNTSS